MAKFLTPEELRELTDAKRPREQIQWLRDRRYTFELSTQGRPKVLWAEVMSRMCSRHQGTPHEPRLRLPQ